MSRLSICMGSACYARGAAALVQLARELDPDGSIELAGCRCTGACAEGPVVVIDGKRHAGMDGKRLRELLSA